MINFRKGVSLLAITASMAFAFTGCDNLLSELRNSEENTIAVEDVPVEEQWNGWEDEFDRMGGERFGDFGDCFTFNFPLSIDCDSVVTTFNNTEELLAFLASNRPVRGDCNNSDSTRRGGGHGGGHGHGHGGFAGQGCDFVYPISITVTSDSSTVSISSPADLQPILQDCYNENDSTST